MSTENPHVTVAAIIEHDDRFLLVEEQPAETVVLNQPAGHVEPGESILDAVIRETFEETGRHFTPDALVGIYTWTNPRTGACFVRFAIHGRASDADESRELDKDIIDTLWLNRVEVWSQRHKLRSPMVLRVIDDYLAGHRHPLSILTDIT
ncbi:NUDIX hydrolase [Thiohalomonas denitrificans]|uniref:Phosphatase NudJ n=1 Tax=Thiohalomonas denitrificans TaxID=415747 RepID=A0A1G5QCH0_9GAMM|nr:NUDIX hydrolase [Thiohalomonas denitrificans]SCZ59200.1 ADP-ribose pyrophosphatase YjhB, NUDIX family [Thiohalomonas denitrificans]